MTWITWIGILFGGHRARRRSEPPRMTAVDRDEVSARYRASLARLRGATMEVRALPASRSVEEVEDRISHADALMHRALKGTS